MTNTLDEKLKFQFSGVKFLFEMELLSNPQALNHIKLNIETRSPYIKDSEFIFSEDERKMLVWIRLSWWGRVFKSKRIENSVLDVLRELLPNYDFRVTQDRNLLELALKKLKGVQGVHSSNVDNAHAE